MKRVALNQRSGRRQTAKQAKLPTLNGGPSTDAGFQTEGVKYYNKRWVGGVIYLIYIYCNSTLEITSQYQLTSA